MRAEFQPHNLFYRDIDLYINSDPNLGHLKNSTYVLNPALVHEIPLHVPGIYILTGARQVGKTTLVKLIIKHLLVKERIPPEQILYLPCDIIRTFQELLGEMEQFLLNKPANSYFYLFIDEVTYVDDWDRAIKYFADLGYFRRGSVLITGSDSVILKEGMKRFPGRRGESKETDFHYYPLSFSDFIKLVEPALTDQVEALHETGNALLQEESAAGLARIEAALKNDDAVDQLNDLFNRYLANGGFLTAINEYANNGRINQHIYNTYVQWVLGDFLKRNKREDFLKEIILALSERLGKQISYHNFTSVTNIQNHSTVQEYFQILTDMDVLFIQKALREDKSREAPKKPKKIHFCDPFIAAALICWAKEVSVNWEFVERYILADSTLKTDIIEGIISSLFKRDHKIFYIKAEAEVDLAVMIGRSFYPIEIKYSGSLKKSDLKQIIKYSKGIVGYKGTQIGTFDQLHVLPLPVLALFV